MKHKLFCFILIFTLLLGSFAFVFAEDDFYYPMISYDINNPTYSFYTGSFYSYSYSLDYPIYVFTFSNNGICFISDQHASRGYLNIRSNGTVNNTGVNTLNSIYNSVYYYLDVSNNSFSDFNPDFPHFSTLQDGLSAFDSYFTEQGNTNNTVFNLGVFVAACLQFVAATASFIMQYPILMMFVLLPVISYIVVLLRRLLLLGS